MGTVLYGLRPLHGAGSLGIDIIPLPCPETLYLGVPSSPGSFLDRLDTPEFSTLLNQLAREVRTLIAERGESPLAIIGVNSSPTCGVTMTYYGDEKSADAGAFLILFSETPLSRGATTVRS